MGERLIPADRNLLQKSAEILGRCHAAQDRYRAAQIRFNFRERMLLDLICRGLSDKEIAAKFDLCPKSGAAIVRKLYRKAGLQDDRQLILYVMQQPQVLQPEGQGHTGLHQPGGDACPYCQAMRAAA